MSLLKIDGVQVTFGSAPKLVRAIESITLDVQPKEFLTIVGPSGAGKTTLLKVMAGLLPPTAGGVYLRDAPVTAPPAELAVVFQEYGRSLYPWLTVKENVLLPLTGLSSQEKETRASEALEAVGLGHAHTRYPWQLSGGMQQRVAIARAIAYQPQILLMDEPFASVDAQTRIDLEDLILKIQRELQMTTVLVTHDIDESIYLGDRICVLSPPPTTVKEFIDINLPRDRDQITTKNLPEFAELRTHVFHQVRRQPVPAA